VAARPNYVLNPRGGESIEVGHGVPSAELRPWLAEYWTSWWDFRGRPVRTSEILTDSAVHVVFERGSSRVVGPTTRVFTRRIEGLGRVVGIRFAPGGFRGFARASIATLVDRKVPLGEVIDTDVAAIEDEVMRADDPGSFAAIERWLLPLRPPPDPAVTLVQRIVARIEATPEITRVEDLLAETDLGLRGLQRLFRDYVGVGPKWVLRRARLREAYERLRTGHTENLAALAATLGYCDQAHFARDFKATTGRSPSQWLRELDGA